MIGDPDLSVGSPADMAHAKERLEAMIEDNGQTWDLSDNDKAAIRWALSEWPDEATTEFRLQNDRDWRAKLAHLKAENERLRDGLQALHFPSDAPNGVLRSVAYDIVMNGMDGETAVYQIQSRTRLHAEKTEQLERVLQAATALAEHFERAVNVGPVSLAPATEAALWINLRNALDAAARG
jgi:hypothetical protein